MIHRAPGDDRAAAWAQLLILERQRVLPLAKTLYQRRDSPRKLELDVLAKIYAQVVAIQAVEYLEGRTIGQYDTVRRFRGVRYQTLHPLTHFPLAGLHVQCESRR